MACQAHRRPVRAEFLNVRLKDHNHEDTEKAREKLFEFVLFVILVCFVAEKILGLVVQKEKQ
ncbi:MAG TPA: hypothetical protein VH702_16825 [Vicinamibacterales bacterium]